jgi:hypothetical protein
MHVSTLMKNVGKREIGGRKETKSVKYKISGEILLSDDFENSFSIGQVARICAVDRRTVRKWLAVDDTRGAAIPRSGWYRLPNGQVRIKRSSISRLQKGD